MLQPKRGRVKKNRRQNNPNLKRSLKLNPKESNQNNKQSHNQSSKQSKEVKEKLQANKVPLLKSLRLLKVHPLSLHRDLSKDSRFENP